MIFLRRRNIEDLRSTRLSTNGGKTRASIELADAPTRAIKSPKSGTPIANPHVMATREICASFLRIVDVVSLVRGNRIEIGT